MTSVASSCFYLTKNSVKIGGYYSTVQDYIRTSGHDVNADDSEGDQNEPVLNDAATSTEDVDYSSKKESQTQESVTISDDIDNVGIKWERTVSEDDKIYHESEVIHVTKTSNKADTVIPEGVETVDIEEGSQIDDKNDQPESTTISVDKITDFDKSESHFNSLTDDMDSNKYMTVVTVNECSEIVSSVTYADDSDINQYTLLFGTELVSNKNRTQSFSLTSDIIEYYNKQSTSKNPNGDNQSENAEVIPKEIDQSNSETAEQIMIINTTNNEISAGTTNHLPEKTENFVMSTDITENVFKETEYENDSTRKSPGELDEIKSVNIGNLFNNQPEHIECAILPEMSGHLVVNIENVGVSTNFNDNMSDNNKAEVVSTDKKWKKTENVISTSMTVNVSEGTKREVILTGIVDKVTEKTETVVVSSDFQDNILEESITKKIITTSKTGKVTEKTEIVVVSAGSIDNASEGSKRKIIKSDIIDKVSEKTEAVATSADTTDNISEETKREVITMGMTDKVSDKMEIVVSADTIDIASEETKREAITTDMIDKLSEKTETVIVSADTTDNFSEETKNEVITTDIMDKVSEKTESVFVLADIIDNVSEETNLEAITTGRVSEKTETLIVSSDIIDDVSEETKREVITTGEVSEKTKKVIFSSDTFDNVSEETERKIEGKISDKSKNVITSTDIIENMLDKTKTVVIIKDMIDNVVEETRCEVISTDKTDKASEITVKPNEIGGVFSDVIKPVSHRKKTGVSDRVFGTSAALYETESVADVLIDKDRRIKVDGADVEDLLMQNSGCSVKSSVDFDYTPSLVKQGDDTYSISDKKDATSSDEDSQISSVGCKMSRFSINSFVSLPKQNTCPTCASGTREVHFHEEQNVVHTISIESGHFLTPLPGKESSKTNLSSQKQELKKNKEEKKKKTGKSTNKPDTYKPVH